jgi:histidinol-phosphate phosphatase family protein
MSVDLIIPTIGRRSLVELLLALRDQSGPLPDNIYLVDDRRRADRRLIERDVELGRLNGRIHLLHSGGRGPAAARNLGWRTSRAQWVAFLDDDVRPAADWLQQLDLDLSGAEQSIAGVQGQLRVPLPAHRAPTDWERNVAGLEGARWITADMAYRRAVLEEVGGFDERFRRAFREDAELALRVTGARYRIVSGRRCVEHPVRAARPWVSVRAQAGNAEDALMQRLHGADWYRRAEAPVGRRPAHLMTTAALLTAIIGTVTRRRWLTFAGLGAWLAGTAEFAWSRIKPGPKTGDEIAAMVLTSVVIPLVATLNWLRGLLRWRSAAPMTRWRPAAILFDRDGTLVEDVPYNGDPERVVARPRARLALDQLRAAGIPVGVVSNQSGIARGLLSREQVEAVNRRLEELLGAMDTWAVCPHGPMDACECRKPAPGLVLRAAAELGVPPEQCLVVGDIGSDVEAARAAGARAILVPTLRTRPEEVAAAPEVAKDLVDAVSRAMRGHAA